MRLLTRQVVLALAALLLSLAGMQGARAETINYRSQPAFEAATTNTATISFEKIAPTNGFISYGNGGSITFNGVNFATDPGIYLYVNSSSYYATHKPPRYDLGSGDYLLAGNGAPAFILVTLPSPATAVGFYFGTFDTTSEVTIATFPNAESFIASAPYPTRRFVGLTFSEPVTAVQIEITDGNRQDTLSLDEFSYGFAIPDPREKVKNVMIIGK
jgi:hypothetical protein